MKRFTILCMLLLMMAVGRSQELEIKPSTDCFGLTNPTSFVLYNNPTTGMYSGKVGEKPSSSQSGNCITGALGFNLTTNVATTALATTTDAGSNSYCQTSLNPSNEFRIMSSEEGPGTGSNRGKDPLTAYGLTYCPPGFTSSVRVGNCQTGRHAEALYYTMRVNNKNNLLYIYYAIVAQAPGHGVGRDPEFMIRVCKPQGSDWVPISDTLCYMVSTTPASSSGTVTIGQDGWHQNGQVYYRDWNLCVINLERYYGDQVRVEVMFGDCSASGHYGYAYVAGLCGPMKLETTGCAAGEGTAVDTISAPVGLAGYQWYRSRNGLLQGADMSNMNNYRMIQENGNGQRLGVEVRDFIDEQGDTSRQNTFMCMMTSYMDPTKPIYTPLYTNVGNTKPTISVDTVLTCDGGIEIVDKSFAVFTASDSDKVDTSLSRWKFYRSTNPTNQTYLGEARGGTARFTFPEAGNYSVKLRTSAYDTTCWNEKTIQVRALKPPKAAIRIQRNDICVGDTITLTDITTETTVNPPTTYAATYHKWTVHYAEGDTTIETATNAVRLRFDETTTVSLETHTNRYFALDSNHDGTVDHRYCIAKTDSVVRVGAFPVLTVHGDTIVCNGDRSDVSVTSDITNCHFNWHTVYHGNTPIVTDNSHLITSITSDRKYYVEVTSPNGCVSWDSVSLYLVSPTLNATKDRICAGDTVKLWAGKAAYYEWSSEPIDFSLESQNRNDTVIVTPKETTTYSVVGHGTNGCGATELKHKVTVYQLPIPAINLTPDYIDSENPSVQFTDVSENSTMSLWNFGNGNTSSVRSVVFTFTDLSKDSIQVALTSTNMLEGCSRDTSFWLPVGIFAVWFPNAFTPKLETNNIFKAFTANDLVDYELYIYDRGGNQVFSTKEVEEGWDGTYKGKDCPQGSYVWIAKYRRPGIERWLSQKGTVTIIR